jgi:energy-coupling factor transport system permease protein
MKSGQPLTLQAWLAWGVAASMPFLLGRNPFPMLVGMFALVAVRAGFPAASAHALGWRVVVRAAALFSAIAILFNVLTVRTGEQVIFTIPESSPLIGGPVTWNAVVYGVLAAAGVLGLVMVWATVGSHVQWASLARLLPDPFVGFAVAGSAAINLVPQTAAALTDIREASAARGYAPPGIRGVGAVLTPMINVGLDRSMRLAEVLEARGFGGRQPDAHRGTLRFEFGWMMLLGGAFTGGYGLIAAIGWAAIGGIAAALAGAAVVFRARRPDAIHRTRYRRESLGRADWIVIGVSVVVALMCAVARGTEPPAFAYEPYPDIRMPVAVLWPLIALLGLFVPALIDPAREADDD